MSTRDQFTEHIQELVHDFERGTWYHSIRLNDGTCHPGLIPIEALEGRLTALGVEKDLTGQRVLDLGAATGFNSFELERRGAEVVAVDYFRHSEFEQARKLLGSRVEYVILDVEECTPERLGTFDIVLFLGVLYHCRHPLLALERVCALTRDIAYVESFVTDVRQPETVPKLTFYEADELGGQVDNWHGPTMSALEALSRSAGFCRLDRRYVSDERLGLACHRRWPLMPNAGPAVRLSSAVNNRTNDIAFTPSKDEYLIVYFDSMQPELAPERVFVEIDGYGVRPITVHRKSEKACQACCRIPPGLSLGSHDVRIRTTVEGWSEAVQIQLQASEAPALWASAQDFAKPDQTGAGGTAPVINKVENSIDSSKRFSLYRSEALCVYFDSPACKVHDLVQVSVGGELLLARILSSPSVLGWQVNVTLPELLENGEHEVRIRTRGSAFSAPVSIQVEKPA